jgi:hypothetical protein
MQTLEKLFAPYAKLDISVHRLIFLKDLAALVGSIQLLVQSTVTLFPTTCKPPHQVQPCKTPDLCGAHMDTTHLSEAQSAALSALPTNNVLQTQSLQSHVHSPKT